MRSPRLCGDLLNRREAESANKRLEADDLVKLRTVRDTRPLLGDRNVDKSLKLIACHK